MYRFLARPRWIGFLLLVLAMIAACLLLARWQWQRLDEREAKNAVIKANIDQRPVPADELLKVGADLPKADLWRSVAVSGTYDDGETLLVRKRVVKGQPGFYVLTPLRGQNGTALWVNRGWIKVAANAMAEPDVPAAPTGTVTVVARMRQNEPPKGTKPTDLPARQIDRMDGATLADAADGKSYGGFGELVSEFPASPEAPEPLAAPEIGGGPHLSYAVQWVTFALVAGVGWYVLIRKERDRLLEERAAAQVAAGRGPDPEPDGHDDHDTEDRTTVEGTA